MAEAGRPGLRLVAHKGVDTLRLAIEGVKPPENPRTAVRVFINCKNPTSETPAGHRRDRAGQDRACGDRTPARRIGMAGSPGDTSVRTAHEKASGRCQPAGSHWPLANKVAAPRDSTLRGCPGQDRLVAATRRL